VSGEVGRLLASGRECDVYEYGPGLVLRRARLGYSLEPEARVMHYVHERGYPVPRVHDLLADGADMVMDRIDGLSLAAAVEKKPWTMSRQARVLAALHARLHEIEAPDWLEAHGDGRTLAHFDLHPLNVIVGPSGPVVIDWANAAAAPGEADVADTWLVMHAAGVDDANPLMRVLLKARRVFVSAFVGCFDRARVVPFLRPVAEARVRDHNMRPHEIAGMWRLVEHEEARLRAGG
jgi:aminoglycoside phosphotransferase (APT) family kinase protein